MLIVLLLLKRPPPALEAELLAKVLLLMITVLLPLLFKRPPPAKEAELLAKVLLLMITVPPWLMRPPPLPVTWPWAIVRALSVKVMPLFTDSTCMLPPPSRVTLWPLPSRGRLFVLMVSVLVMGMVPLQPKVMVSPLAALLMALSRWDSSQVLTGMVAAGWAWAVLLASPRLASTLTPSSMASPTRRAQDQSRSVRG